MLNKRPEGLYHTSAAYSSRDLGADPTARRAAIGCGDVDAFHRHTDTSRSLVHFRAVRANPGPGVGERAPPRGDPQSIECSSHIHSTPAPTARETVR